jgi:flagellar basal body-associated protein FliL
MSEEQEVQETNDGTWSGLKKTIIGTLTTVIAGGGVWVSTLIFGGSDEPAEETKTEQPAAQPVINLNVQQNQENKQKVENGGGTHVIERVVEKPTSTQPAQPQPKPQEESW